MNNANNISTPELIALVRNAMKEAGQAYDAECDYCEDRADAAALKVMRKARTLSNRRGVTEEQVDAVFNTEDLEAQDWEMAKLARNVFVGPVTR
jgi:hypothetical protein